MVLVSTNTCIAKLFIILLLMLYFCIIINFVNNKVTAINYKNVIKYFLLLHNKHEF